ncbi:hypothetical protein BHU11_02415 [Tannerella sp. oral taxon 808]|nr:hypothetical protein BHU11_02415 [Tannerella sp. oral taxon 808]
MKTHISNLPSFLLCALILTLAGCRKSTPTFTVAGTVAGAEGQIIYLENIGLASVSLLDSAKVNASGKFSFKSPRPEYPDFYRLRLKNQWINFAIDSTESLTITADAKSFATSYTVEGSNDCVAIKEITLAQLDAGQEIRHAREAYQSGALSDTAFRRCIAEAATAYKDVARKYIYARPMSTAAYFALFQQVDGMFLFDPYDKEDSRAFGAVATSYHTLYPESPRSKHLYSLALQSLKVTHAYAATPDSITAHELDMIDMELPDLQGTLVKLSDVARGHITILCFTAYETDWAPTLNLSLGSLYEKYRDRGLRIYQISLGDDVHYWKNVASHLAWTCVRAPESSHYAALYNVRSLPTLFILDRHGAPVKRVDNLDRIEGELVAAGL